MSGAQVAGSQLIWHSPSRVLLFKRLRRENGLPGSYVGHLALLGRPARAESIAVGSVRVES
jgi:hypothetical protein